MKELTKEYIKNCQKIEETKQLSLKKNKQKIFTETLPKKIERWQINTRKDVHYHLSLGKCKLRP